MRTMTLRYLALFVIAMLLCGSIFAATPVPMQWADLATLYGPSSNKFILAWSDANLPRPDFFEVEASAFERPTRVQLWRWGLNELKVTKDPTQPTMKLEKEVQLPGNGHFVFRVRACFLAVPLTTPPTAACAPWSSSIDPAVALVNGAPRGFWVYGYLPAPGPLKPLNTAPAPERPPTQVAKNLPQRGPGTSK